MPVVCDVQDSEGQVLRSSRCGTVVDNDFDGSVKQLLWPTITHVGSTGTPSGRVASTWTRLGLGKRWVVAWFGGKRGGMEGVGDGEQISGRQLDD